VAVVTTGDPKAVAKKLKPSVVGVTAVVATTKTKIYQSIGTGVVYSATASSGYIVTNNHVIIRDDGTPAKRIRVTLPSGSTVTATLVGRDPDTDIAVLKVKARNLKAPVFRTDLAQLAPGEFVVAIGNAKVLAHPVTSGNVTALLENIEYPGLSGVHEVIESTVPLAHGNSGGPLADAEAQVVGINMAELLSGEGGISLPMDLVVEVVERLIASG
jgi:S1-C subfamily serine protease